MFIIDMISISWLSTGLFMYAKIKREWCTFAKKNKMADQYQIVLKPGKEAPVERFHPWVFSGAIMDVKGNPKPGDLVDVQDYRTQHLGWGFYEKSSLAVKIFSFDKDAPDQAFWTKRIADAYYARKSAGLTSSKDNNAYRLVFSEGDMMPGLIIDFYNGVAVFQANSLGMFSVRKEITKALIEVFGESLKAVYNKSAVTLRNQAGISTTDSFLYGDLGVIEILEHGCRYVIDVVNGQKTGFFLDQRENRRLLMNYAQGKRVLNTFCYTGGFSVVALAAGAKEVHSVDTSAPAIEATKENLKLNGFKHEVNPCVVKDALDYLGEMKEEFDVIVLDPPAFAKHHTQRHKALSAYKHINKAAFKKIAKGGIIFTFSCSQVVDRMTFHGIVAAAAIETGRQVRILHQMNQPADHPMNIFHQEGEYLKGLVLLVE